MTRLVALLFGAGFGGVLAWAQLTDPERIRQMLVLEDAHYYLMMAVAVVVGTVGDAAAPAPPRPHAGHP